jgi:elongation factor G
MKKVYDPNNIRNVVVLGHQGSGKTSLIEALLFEQKVISKKGTVEEGTTVSDYTKEEKTLIFLRFLEIQWMALILI